MLFDLTFYMLWQTVVLAETAVIQINQNAATEQNILSSSVQHLSGVVLFFFFLLSISSKIAQSIEALLFLDNTFVEWSMDKISFCV